MTNEMVYMLQVPNFLIISKKQQVVEDVPKRARKRRLDVVLQYT